MNCHRPDTILYVLILFKIIIFGDCDLHNQLNFQHRRAHLQNRNFGDKDYLDYSDTNERLDQDASSTQNQAPLINTQPLALGIVSDPGKNSINFTSSLDSHIKWDKNWLQNLQLGQLSAVDVDLNGNIVIFCRRHRTWEISSFGTDNKYDPNETAIDENVIFLFDKNGKKLSEWGKNMFYLPHGLTIDSNRNYWVTDVAMHQVFKFDKHQIDQYLEKMKTKRKNHSNEITLVPSLVLGVAFEPGNDDKSFCKPTAVAVAKNGDFFVSDGYCNSRIIKFNSKGEKILQFGRSLQPGFYQTLPSVYSFFVPHALALAEELGIIFVADRENGRILSYHKHNGTFHKEYKHPAMGPKIFSIAYAKERLCVVNGQAMIGVANHFHVRGFIIDINTSEILSQFGPDGDMVAPHDIAITKDASEIYVVELTVSKAYRFIQEPRIAPDEKIEVQKVKPISYNEPDKISSTKTALLFFAGAVFITGLCVAVAAIIAKCRKRGCLLTVRRKAYWDTERKDNFKLSSLLESRQGKSLRIFGNRPNTRDFSKLNTEPESSEEDLVEDSITI